MLSAENSRPAAAQSWRRAARSMRTIRPNHIPVCTPLDACDGESSGYYSTYASDNLGELLMDVHLRELAAIPNSPSTVILPSSLYEEEELLSDDSISNCSDISGELQRLANLPSPEFPPESEDCEPCVGFLQRDHFSSEIIDSISAEDLQPTVVLCIDALKSNSTAIQRSAAAKLRFLAKNRADHRLLIAESGSVPALVQLIRSSDALTQEHAVTAVLNLSLHEANKGIVASSGAIKALVYALKTGTEAAKQNAACALLSLAMVEGNRVVIGACGAVPPLVSLLMGGSVRGKKDALTTMYKLCTVRQNKERAVAAGAVAPLVAAVGDPEHGMAEKAMVVLHSLAAIDAGREAIVEEAGIPALVEAIEDSSVKGKEFAVLTLIHLCVHSVRNREFLVREGAIPPLVALSQSDTHRVKHKAEILLGYLRECRQEGSCSARS